MSSFLRPNHRVSITLAAVRAGATEARRRRDTAGAAVFAAVLADPTNADRDAAEMLITAWADRDMEFAKKAYKGYPRLLRNLVQRRAMVGHWVAKEVAKHTAARPDLAAQIAVIYSGFFDGSEDFTAARLRVEALP